MVVDPAYADAAIAAILISAADSVGAAATATASAQVIGDH